MKNLFLSALVCAVCVFFTNYDAYSDEKRLFKLQNSTIKIDVPKNWESARNMFGLPLVILGPMTEGSRPVIGITDIGSFPYALNESELKSDEKSYQLGRQAWVKKYNGFIREFHSYKKVRWPASSEVHSVGVRYRVGNAEVDEKSYYFSCNQKLFHIKTQLKLQHEKPFQSAVQDILRSFSCGS